MMETSSRGDVPGITREVSIRTVVRSRYSTVAPMRRRISSDREISFTGGMFSSVQVPRTRMVANKIGSAAFFIPLMVTSPQSGFPPCIMILLAMLIPNGRKPHSAFLSRRMPFASYPYHYIITLEKRKAFFCFFLKKDKTPCRYQRMQGVLKCFKAETEGGNRQPSDPPPDYSFSSPLLLPGIGDRDRWSSR